MIRRFKQFEPKIHETAYIDEAATVIGEVEIMEGASVWPGAVLRGDMGLIKVKSKASIQDNVSAHATRGQSTVEIGENVSVGHGVVLHGCRVGDNCVIGMNAVLMDNCEIGEYSVVAAGAVVTQNKKFPPKSVIAGVPAKVMKEADQAILDYIKWNAKEYEDTVREYRKG